MTDEQAKNQKDQHITSTPNDQDGVFEDIFQHIDIDSIEAPVGKKIEENQHKKEGNKEKEGTKGHKKEVKKKKIKKQPAKATVKRNIKAKHAEKKEINNLNIEDIGAYIASTKAQQEKRGMILKSQNGTLLQDIPNIYAIVPHIKGDHKLVFLKDNAPNNLEEDAKKRTAGSVYMKKGMKIYDVHVDFKEHPSLKSKDGQRLDVWVINHPDDLINQIHAIQAGKGGGTNFQEPRIFDAVGVNTEEKRPIKEDRKYKEEIKKEKKKEKREEQREDKKIKRHEEGISIKTDTSTSANTKQKPRETVVDKKEEVDKKPRDDSTQTMPTKNITEEEKPREKEQEKKEGDIQDIAPKKPREIDSEEKSSQENKPKEEPFSNAVDALHETDTDRHVPPPEPIMIDDVLETSTPGDAAKREEVIKKDAVNLKKQEEHVALHKKAPIKEESKIKGKTPPIAEITVEETPELLSAIEKKQKVPTPTPGAFNLDTVLDTGITNNTTGVNKGGETQQDIPQSKETPEVHPIYQQTANLDSLLPDTQEDMEDLDTYESHKHGHNDTYNEDDEYDDEEDEEGTASASKKILILVKIIAFLAILLGLIWFIYIMFFSGGGETSKTPGEDTQDIAPELQDNKIPKVVPEGEQALDTEDQELGNTDTPEEEVNDELSNLDTNFTLPELTAKLESQMREAQRLLKDARFINNKRAIMFSTTAEVRANTLLAEIEKDRTISAKEVQDAAEKIDYYIQQASKLLQ